MALDFPPVRFVTPAPLVVAEARAPVVVQADGGAGVVRVEVRKAGRVVDVARRRAPADGGQMRLLLRVPPGTSLVRAIAADGGGERLVVERLRPIVPGFAALLARFRVAATPRPPDGRREIGLRDHAFFLAAVVGLERRTGYRAGSVVRAAARQAARGSLPLGRLYVAGLTMARALQQLRRPVGASGSLGALPTAGRLGRYEWRIQPGAGIAIHPLGTIRRVAQTAAGSRAFFAQLEAALDLGVERRSGRLHWLTPEYPWAFPSVSPRAPWASSMANAAMVAQLARAERITGDPRYHELMQRYLAGLALPYWRGGLSAPTGAGRWYLEYAQAPGLRVLNGFLQTVASLGAADRQLGGANRLLARLFDEGLDEAAARLPAYDVGGWSLYSQHKRADLHYHRYHIELLRNLARASGRPVFAYYARRWAAAIRGRR